MAASSKGGRLKTHSSFCSVSLKQLYRNFKKIDINSRRNNMEKEDNSNKILKAGKHRYR